MNRLALLSLAAICAGGVPACGIGFLLNENRTAREAVAHRLAAITAPHRPAEAGSGSEPGKPQAGSLATLRMEAVFGYRRVRRMQYAVAFSRVLAIAGAGAMVAGLLGLRVLGAPGLLAAPALWIVLSRLYYRRCNRRRSATLFRQFPDALGMIVRAVRVGVPLGRSIALIAEEAPDPTAAEFRQLAEEVTIGLGLAEALRAMGARNELTEYRFFATALTLQSQTGGGLAETLETLADTVRKRVAARERGHALAAEARASCYVLGGLPFVVGVLLFISNPTYMSVLFTTSSGLKLLAAAAASLSVGLVMMQQITNRSLA